MHVPRLYLPQRLAQGDVLTLGEQATHHVTQVLRLRPGAAIKVFDGEGREHEAMLREVRRAQVTVEVGKTAAGIPEPPLAITLAQGIARGDRMDLILQKAVELGVSAVQPLWMARSQTRTGGERIEKRLHHWQGVVISACEQCGRATLPALAAPAEYRSWLSGAHPRGCRMLLDPQAQRSLGDMQRPGAGDSILLLVGPEGGISAEETALAAAAGFTGVRLGPRILRTETAALAMLAALQSRWGDLH
jgi:16S rRNA (uracil1498-N3)-methyltransferase